MKMDVAELKDKIVHEVEKAIIGKRDLLEKVITAVFVNGHVLFEDNPGLGKTALVKCLAKALGLEFKRIQFTPDLLPSDIVGGYIFNKEKGEFQLQKGPVFANIILADEINRASPKTQSALLEAMEEQQITIEGQKMSLPEPFVVFATQNPIEAEGTFPLPEAQLDRFIMKLSVGYPSLEDEQKILSNRRNRKKEEFDINQVTNLESILKAKQKIENVHVEADLEKYIVQIIHQTRADTRVTIGASPRGSLAVLKLARAWAAIQKRNYVLPDDIKKFTISALTHRLLLVPDLWMSKSAAVSVVEEALMKISVPVFNN
ncbi:MAG: MoxR family ATPase [Deltaproteobacteria bacterium]|nr:MoxR family ATPase [Deltaproteobacteria bacterium]